MEIGSAPLNLNETQPEWHPQTNEGVMGELTHQNKTVVCVCALEPITEAYTKPTGCIQWEAMVQTGLFCRALGYSVLSSCFVVSVWVVFQAWLGHKGTEGLQEHHVLTAGANPEWEVIVLHSCTFPRPVPSHKLKCDTVHKFSAHTFHFVQCFFDKLFPFECTFTLRRSWWKLFGWVCWGEFGWLTVSTTANITSLCCSILRW